MSKYFQIAKEISKVQNFKEIYSKLFSGKISPYMAAAFVPTSVTPNHLTLAMIPSGLIGGFICMAGSHWGFLIGGLFFVLLNILDAADGELARYTKKTSDFGDYLDRVAHYATNSMAVLGVGLGLYLQTGYIWILYIMVLLEISMVLDEAVRDLLMACGLDKKTNEDESRKQVKLRSKLHAPGFVTKLWELLFSNVAFFHILPVIAVIGMMTDSAHYLVFYYVIFAAVSGLKISMRMRSILKNYS